MEVEADAGALSGIEPVRAGVRANRSTWYDRVTRGIRMRGGKGVGVPTDQHPDALAEAVRQQICEAELVQAIGRGRGVSRTTEAPLDVDILADVVLPITVDEVREWDAPGLEVEMVAEGVWLESPADMAKAWPDVWADAMAARNWLRGNSVYFPLIVYDYQGKLHTVRFLHVRYQLAGPKQHWHVAWVDPAVVPDVRGWLEARLGPLAGYEVVTVLLVLRAADLTLAPLEFGTPELTVRPGPGQEKPAHELMCQAIDAQPPEYFTAFGITKDSWQRWRRTGEGTCGSEQEKLPWSTPVVDEVPEEVAALWALPPVIEGGSSPLEADRHESLMAYVLGVVNAELDKLEERRRAERTP
jgi:hypothetical protein